MRERLGCLSVIVALALLVALPWLFADVLEAALLKLHLGPVTATAIVAGIFVGSLINVPLYRVERLEAVSVDPLALVGLSGFWPGAARSLPQTVVAINVGGCVIPTCLALYEAGRLVADSGPVGGASLVTLLSVLVCYRLARVVSGVGILLPGLVPPATAALAALLLTPAQATPVAFIAGTLGPLIGADLLHLRDVERTNTGLVSIGGAGTFDGILLSGIWALYLS